jgi:hypothetical protein
MAQIISIADIKGSNVINVDGIFEIHLIVRPEDERKLFLFLMSHHFDEKTHMNIKVTRALSFYGNYPDQPMLTFWMKGNSQTVVDEVKIVADVMQNSGMIVGRLKVEAMAHNVNIQALELKDSNNYFEFHFKVNIKNIDEWNIIRDVCLPYGSHLFFNPYSKSPGYMQPVVTLRRYSNNFAEATADLSKLTDAIISSHFPAPEKIQSEFSIIDSNVFYDQGWLFKEDPKTFITSHE